MRFIEEKDTLCRLDFIGVSKDYQIETEKVETIEDIILIILI